MKTMTIIVKFADGQEPERVTFGDKVLGGEVTGLAAYDMMHTMEIAEGALENSNDDKCIDAAERIEKYIVEGM